MRVGTEETPDRRIRRSLRLASLAVALVLALVAVACGSDSNSGGGDTGSSGSDAAKDVTIGFVYPGDDQPFWLSAASGARDAAGSGIEVTVAGGSTTAKPTDMIPRIQNLVTQGVDALVVPAFPNIVPALKQAVQRDIPIIVYGGTLPDDAGVPVAGSVTTDNLGAGHVAGRYIREQLNGKGTLAVLDILQGNAFPELAKRVQGVKEELRGTQIKIVSTAYTECNPEKSVAAAQNMLVRTPNLDAFFGACGTAIAGALEAVHQANIPADRILTVGLDAVPPELKAILAGEEDATIAQYPTEMAKKAVTEAATVARGGRVPALSYSPNGLVDKSNAQELLDQQG